MGYEQLLCGRKDEGRNMQYTSYELLWLFFIYSVLGWAVGVVIAAVKRKKFVNTGVLSMPMCPVYGFGAVLNAIFLTDLKSAPVFLAIGGAVLSSFLVVVTGVVLEHIFHRKWWDYSEKKLGFGYITIPLLLLYGAAALGELYFGNPLLLKLVHFIPNGLGKIVLLIVGVLFLIDLSGALAVVWKWRRHINRVANLTENMQMLSDSFEDVITRTVRKRLEKSYPNIETEKILDARRNEKEAEKTKFAEGCGFYKLVWLFLIGALLGDLVETVFCRFTLGWWMSRSSVVYGPFSVVWGMGCALLTAFLYKYKDKSDRYIFFYGTVVGGAYEYLCSVVTELVFGTTFWDYSSLPFNLGGRINLLYCFFWGIAAVVWLKGIYPFLAKWIEKIPKKIGPALTWILIVLMCADMLISSLALSRYSARQLGEAADTKLEQVLDAHFPDERMARIYPKAKFVEK